MIKVILSGICGHMGAAICKVAQERDDFQIVAGVDINESTDKGFPVFADFTELAVKGDVIVDFSHPSVLAGLLDYAVKTGTPAVLATTGYSEEQKKMVDEAAKQVPIFRATNFSIGVNLLAQLATICARVLGDQFDIEIVEAHHNQKLDAPSGTAKTLAKAVEAGLSYEPEYVYERESRREKRHSHEIGMHSIRGGTIVGEHEIIFAGRDEIVTISHSARSKEVFAVGALNAAAFIIKQEPGRYSMPDMIG